MSGAFLHIGHNDVRLFLREKTSYIWLLLVPLVFTYFMGFAVRGPGDPANPAPAVLIENHDRQFLGRIFLDVLGAQGLERVAPTNAASARRGLRVPADFTERVLAGQQAKVDFFHVGSDDDPAAAMVEIRLVRALVDVNSLLVEHAALHPGAALTEGGLTNLLAQRQDAVQLKASFAGRKPMPVGYRLSIPGNLVVYLMMNLLIFGGASLAWERRSGVLRRLRVQPIRRGALVAGKIYGLVVLGTIQTVFLLAAGRFLFGVRYGEQLPAILLTLLVYSWVAASLGVLLGSTVKAEEKIVGLCILTSLAMAALGGCWWPLEIVPEPMKLVAHLLPTGWAMDALHQLITFGGGFAAAKEEIGVLILFGLAFNFGAARWFRV